MTYEQILKEFDEKIETYDKDGGFIVYVEGYDNQDFDVDLIKSFLKQSFIKYLQSEVEACNQYKTFYNPVGDEFNKGKHKAMDDRVERLQAQIKELEA